MEDNGGFGFVYFCGPEEEDRLEHMEQYICHKMRQIGAPGFIAIEDTQRTPGYAFRRIVTVGDMVMQYQPPAPAANHTITP